MGNSDPINGNNTFTRDDIPLVDGTAVWSYSDTGYVRDEPPLNLFRDIIYLKKNQPLKFKLSVLIAN